MNSNGVQVCNQNQNIQVSSNSYHPSNIQINTHVTTNQYYCESEDEYSDQGQEENYYSDGSYDEEGEYHQNGQGNYHQTYEINMNINGNNIQWNESSGNQNYHVHMPDHM
mmetsp:Transcript_26241/g.23104  ORF Transcript_26241/g.23104 Transcript_26241/m.23104 type:complete len:110 (+) Transcript_26241:223-552(+)